MIALQAVNYRAGSRHILRDIDLQLGRGEFLVLVGPSGAGKTSLLRLIAGLAAPLSGRVSIAGQLAAAGGAAGLPPQRRRIGFVFQDLALWSHMRVAEHIDWPLRLARVGAAERRRRVAELLEMVQLGDKQRHYPHTLSGGEQQRLALARALAGKPEILLLDEPFASLDSHLRVELRQLLRQLHRDCGTTSVLVTHDQQEAMALADRIAVMRAGQLLQIDCAERILAAPARPFVAAFFGSPPGCLLPARDSGDGYRCLGQPLRLDLPPVFRRPLEVYYRPQRLQLRARSGGGASAVDIVEALPLADRWHYRLRSGGRTLNALAAAGPGSAGGRAWLRLPQRPDAVFYCGAPLRAKKLLLARHAMSEWNREGRLQGRADIPLAAQAAAQLQVLRRQLQGQRFARVEASPLRRARSSAEAVAPAGGDIDIVAGWREIDVGCWEGRLVGDLDPRRYSAWRAGQYTPAGGESWEQFCARIGAELERLRALDGDTLVVCHGGVIRACRQLLLGTGPDSPQPFDYASLHTFWLAPPQQTADKEQAAGEEQAAEENGKGKN